MTTIQFGKRLGALCVCFEVDDSHDRPQVRVREEHPGPLKSRDRAGKVLGFGCGDDVADAIRDACRDAVGNLSRGEV